MARLIWTENAIVDLDEIAEYISFDNPDAARRLIARVTFHVDQLARHPLSGPVITDFPNEKYRQIIERQCRVIYRYDETNVIILRVLRNERQMRPSFIEDLQ